jgi:hypothetical protein
MKKVIALMLFSSLVLLASCGVTGKTKETADASTGTIEDTTTVKDTTTVETK